MTGDIGETVDCPNCGHPNPAWAQVCRNCGISLQRELGRPITRPTTPFPTDQASLTSVGAAVASIILAIALGLFFSAINPTQPTVGLSVSSPTPSPTPVATPTQSAKPTPKPTPTPTPRPPGTITFGTGLNRSTHKVTNPTDSFVPHEILAYSVTVPSPFGTSRLAVEVSKVVNGKETVVDPRSNNGLTVNPNLKIFGVAVPTDTLLRAYGGGGVFMLRVYRGSEKLAEGKFTLSSG
jgi:hypothetical protein